MSYANFDRTDVGLLNTEYLNTPYACMLIFRQAHRDLVG